MKAYKGFSVDSNNNLDCRGFKFKVGEEITQPKRREPIRQKN
jgi:hypothetical protein